MYLQKKNVFLKSKMTSVSGVNDKAYGFLNVVQAIKVVHHVAMETSHAHSSVQVGRLISKATYRLLYMTEKARR